LIQVDRGLGSIVYDAVKQLAAFTRLVHGPNHAAVFQALRPDCTPGVAGGGSGIRIDLPGEDRYRAEWHQEFPAQFRSARGLVFWSPLRSLTPALGPVEICVGSHHLGALPVRDVSGETSQSGAYALRLADESVVNRYEPIAPLLEVGDLLVMDFFTLHRSGWNTSDRARWTMQARWFDFRDPLGVSIGWVGSFAAGKGVGDVLPELFASDESAS
jgi:hypothetical protein